MEYAIYAKENNLLNTHSWNQFKNIAKHEQCMLCRLDQSKICQVRRMTKYNYRFEVPKSYMEAIGFDTLNGNHKWRDSTKKELDSIDEYETFSYKGKAIYNNGTMANSPVGYKKIRVHLIFDIKHDGRHKARLVADGYLMEIPVESVYSGVVSI